MLANNSSQPDKSNEEPVLALLQQIKDGRIAPGAIDKEARQQCVELLDAEGYTYSQMAQVLKCSEKTIARDMKDIRRRNELSPNVEFAKQFIGEMFNKAMNHHAYLMRLGRMKDASISEKMQSEFAAWKVLKELIEKLQSLGYLPQKPQELIADFSHHVSVDDEKSFKELRLQIAEIEKVSSEFGELAPEMKRELKELKHRLEKAEIESKVIDISDKQKQEAKDAE
jgi:transposase